MAKVRVEQEQKARRWVRDKAVMSYCGEITAMTLWRWRRDPNLGFPKPVKINKTNLTDLDQIDTWLVKRALAKSALIIETT
jgi:predicted DNA-binding transcriptional regulator AlpA